MLRFLRPRTAAVLFFLCAGTIGFSQPRTAATVNDVPAALKALWPPGQPGVDYNVTDSKGMRQGTWMRVYPSGALYYLGEFKGGKPTGTFTFYYEMGEIMTVVVHDANGEGMHAKHYRQNGSLRAEGRYLATEKRNAEGEIEREKDGLWKYYDEQGGLRVEEHYLQGKQHGASRSFGARGEVLESGFWKSGAKDSTWTVFTSKGTTESQLTYVNGLLNGPQTTYFESGKIEATGSNKDGMPDGKWTYYGTDGQIRSYVHFNRGKWVSEERMHGTFEEFRDDGRPKSTTTYRNGKLHGPFREWHDTGGYEVIETVDQTTGNPERKQVLSGLQVSRQGEYFQGQLQGQVTFFDLNGNVEKVETWEKGVLKSSGPR